MNFLRYRVEDSGCGLHEVFAEVNRCVYQGYGPDWRERCGQMGVLNDTLFQYERLLRALSRDARITCLPFRDLLCEPPLTGRVSCAIRHDIDLDIRAALDQAEMEARRGIRTTYFVLHTAPYYGTVRSDGVFVRHGCMIHAYRRLQALGHEIALHTDPLLLYQQHGIDGAQALVAELAWLRSEGIDLVGTTAHNSASVYGAENFAVFRGRPQRLSGVQGCPPEVVHNGRRAPLQVLDERELGLRYEANELFWQGERSVRYGATRTVNRWRWVAEMSRPRARVAPVDRTRSARGFVSFEEVESGIAGAGEGDVICLVVHPEYYGARHSISSGPFMRMYRGDSTPNDTLGWETYVPHTLQARCGDWGGEQEFQSLNMSNEHGMLDLPKGGQEAQAALRVLLLGGKNADGADCGAPGQVQALLSEYLSEEHGRAIPVWKLAHPDIDFTRCYAWFAHTRESIRPDIVVIGLGAEDALLADPEFWSRLTGYDSAHPPGEYLSEERGTVSLIERCAQAELRRRAPQGAAVWERFERDGTAAYELETAAAALSARMRYFADRVREAGAKPVILLHECGERAGLWRGEAELEKLQELHRRVAAWAKEIAAAADAPLIDPYPAFVDLPPGPSGSHWRASGTWSYVGHRLCARACADVLSDLVAAPSPQT